MNSNVRPLSAQEEVNLEKEEQEEYERLIHSSNKETLTNPQDSLSTQMELSPSIITQTEEQQNQLEPQVNSEVLENLMSTLPPELSQILATVIPQLQSGSSLQDLSSMMSSQMDEEISDSMLESLGDLFK